MRFMEWSKSYFPVRFAALALVGAFVASLGVVALPSEAQARRGNVWSVKFKCSLSNINPYAGTGLVIDLPYLGVLVDNDFVLQTIVNIHNPTNKEVRFNKKVVIVGPQHLKSTSFDPTEVSGKDGITLDANEAHSVDCEDIVDILAGPELGTPVIDPLLFDVEGIFEGFVVIESERGKNIPDLAVCANYISFVIDEDTVDSLGTSLDVECFDPIRVRFKGAFQLF